MPIYPYGLITETTPTEWIKLKDMDDDQSVPDPDPDEGRKLAVNTAEMLLYQGRVEALTLVLDDLYELAETPGLGNLNRAQVHEARALVKARRDRDRAVLRHLEDQIDA